MKLHLFLPEFIFIFILFFSICGFSDDTNSETENIQPPIPSPTMTPLAPKPSKSLWTAYILRQKKTTEKIPDLTLPIKRLPVLMVQKEGRIRPMIEVNATLSTQGWNLYFDSDTPISLNKKTNEFDLFFYLNSYINEFLLTAKGPKGEVLTERIYVYAPNIQEFQIYSAWDSILISFGETLFNYNQTRYGKFRSLTGMLTAQYSSPDSSSHFGYFAQGDLSILTQWSSPEKQNPQIFEVKLDGTYLLETSTFDLRWRPQIVVGMSYLNMYNNNSPFGFSNLISPDVGFRLRYNLSQKKTYIIDFRYVPLVTPIDLTHRGIDLYAGFSYFLPNFHRIEFGFSFSDYYYLPRYDQYIHTQFATIKLGYGL